ncbi:MAG TPA: hypothetical protein VMU19_09105 [Bryobacteraceae bacterium]|nr:hypothetical protein [Bryobacteraceae bacterium]
MRLTLFLKRHAVGLGALLCFTALGAYVLAQAQFEKPRVIYVVNAPPQSVEVRASATEPEDGDPGATSGKGAPNSPKVHPAWDAGATPHAPRPR